MTCAEALYETCEELFVKYPQAVRADGGDQTSRSMVLLLREDVAFYVLWLDHDEDEINYSIGPWSAGDEAQISVHRSTGITDTLVRAICSGVPIPRDGSLFGWTPDDVVLALIVVYAEYAPDSPEPSWTIMPLAGAAESQWPPFVGERLFGPWFWEYYQAGNIISLRDLIAQHPDTVFWVDATAALGSASCVVADDISDSCGHVLRRGRYVYFQALRAGKAVPPLEALLADPGKADLAPQLEWSSHTAAEAKVEGCTAGR
jgi:hypothetical protein